MVATRTVVTTKALDVLMSVRSDALELAPADALEAEAAAKTVPATVAGAANAPMAAARTMVNIAPGAVRMRVLSILSAIRSRSISRPRARRCLAASSLILSASATARTDWP